MRKQMTLAEWSATYSIRVTRLEPKDDYERACILDVDTFNRPDAEFDLFNLSDYRAGSLSGGTRYLTSKPKWLYAAPNGFDDLDRP